MTCDWYFEEDEFKPHLQDASVARVLHDPLLDKETKKALILCWFKRTYGENRTDPRTSPYRKAMSNWIRKMNAGRVEELL